ncbi:MAG: tRNA (cytidine(34)-2'-O)-methyltransferase [Desulfotomaculum sp.]|nr:tRNA (cytidine(34)-2'-O)-methyltransferase [Desulfotomaculum sp.]
MHIVLVEPEIPANTGNISRTCAVTDAGLHLIRPLGFSTADKHLKRAGLDYWHKLDLHYYDNFAELQQKHPKEKFWYIETGGSYYYHEVEYQPGDFLVFGKETTGLSKGLLAANRNQWVKIPMLSTGRSLNLSNAVALVLYEALRQQGFKGMMF